MSGADLHANDTPELWDAVTLPVTCPACAHRIQIINITHTHQALTHAILKCPAQGCRKTWHLKCDITRAPA